MLGPACSTEPREIGSVSRSRSSHLALPASQAPFKLTANRADFVHAVVGYFDIEFGCCHKAIGFSTSPRARSTHWKQAGFYLADTLAVSKGETISGFTLPRTLIPAPPPCPGVKFH